jgi:hypothetical protein
MLAQDHNNRFVADCTATLIGNAYHVTGTFQCQIPVNATDNELDQIERQVDHLGQQFKRHLCQTTLETADDRCSELLQQAQPDLIKNGKPPFTIVTKFGAVHPKRQRLRQKLTGKSLTPSAILWKTSKKRHITKQAIEAACDASQEVSYRKAAKQLAETAGVEKLLSTSTVWNKKQEKGKELAQKQDDLVRQVLTQQEVPPLIGVPSREGKCRIEQDTIQVQLDEVKTKSQEEGKKWNNTYTATLATPDNLCYYFVAESAEKLIQQVVVYLSVLGLYLGKRLEVVSDGATWISDWVRSIEGVAVEQVLCWYHLRKRIYEGLGALGLPKDRRKLLQQERLGHLWRGETAKAVWSLWGLRSSARLPKRIDDLMGYLLRKRRMIVNYEARRERGLWLASTRVEKWNDTAVAERCKHNGTSWTANGVLAVALYAAEKKRNAKIRHEKKARSYEKSHTNI